MLADHVEPNREAGERLSHALAQDQRYASHKTVAVIYLSPEYSIQPFLYTNFR
jgi:hypothetical protein